MRIVLARHGETPWNAEGRYQGQMDIALSKVGERQALLLGKRLREVQITRAVSSPMVRVSAKADRHRLDSNRSRTSSRSTNRWATA